jgi:hypothetical protein
MTDDRFFDGFEACNLANKPFHHSDHVRMAFLYLRRFPGLEAIQRFSAALMRFAAAKGKPDLYHETVTWAFLLLIRERMARVGHPQTWAEFAAGNADLLTSKDDVLLRYYCGETLSSDLARRTFLFPDKGIAGGSGADQVKS